jgi:hypothetical protein
MISDPSFRSFADTPFRPLINMIRQGVRLEASSAVKEGRLRGRWSIGILGTIRPDARGLRPTGFFVMGLATRLMD